MAEPYGTATRIKGPGRPYRTEAPLPAAVAGFGRPCVAKVHLPEGERENSPGWSPPERTEPWEQATDKSVPSRRDGRNPPRSIMGPNSAATGVDGFGCPYGAKARLPEGESENSPGWSPPERTEPWEQAADTYVPSRRDGRNTPRMIMGPNRVATVVDGFGRPYGASAILQSPTQGSIRCGELHPGLLSLLPPGAFDRRAS